MYVDLLYDVQENLKALKEREKEEAFKAQQEILARRNNPKLMREYDEKVDANRLKLAQERAVYNSFQSKKEVTIHPLLFNLTSDDNPS